MMKRAQASALVMIVAGVFGLGVWIGRLTVHGDNNKQAPVAQAATPAAEITQSAPLPRQKRSPQLVTANRPTSSAVTPVTVQASAPDLEQRLKPLLNKGANMDLASQDFSDGEQFAMVAHAARNTEIPFMVLKHRVVFEGKSLADAIHEFKPALNASVESNRAQAEAKSDLAAIAG